MDSAAVTDHVDNYTTQKFVLNTSPPHKKVG
jgi:hypothetical protein